MKLPPYHSALLAMLIAILLLEPTAVDAFPPTLKQLRCVSIQTTRIHGVQEDREKEGPFTMRNKYGYTFGERNRVNYRTTFSHDDWVEYRKRGMYVAGDDAFGEPLVITLASGAAGVFLIILISLVSNHHS